MRGRPPVAWSDALATGDEEIDEQHRQLYAQTAALQEAVRYGEFARALVTLDHLERYVTEHFSAEERWMAVARHSRRSAHAALHRAFVADFLERKRRLLELGPVASLPSDLAEWLARWIEDHVQTADAELSREAQRRERPARGGPSQRT